MAESVPEIGGATEYLTNNTDLTKVANAIRAKGGTTEQLIYPDGFVTAISNIPTGGTPSEPPAEADINFYDYDGTLLYAWSLDELAGKTALPDLPTRTGLTCQGWNCTLAELQAENRRMNVGAIYTTDDGTTRIYISLYNGRLSPMLGLGVNGTVTVDWGDGTSPTTLTGSNIGTAVYTPTHDYAAAGEYVIKLSVDGTAGFVGAGGTNAGASILRYSASADNRNSAYRNAVKKIEIGSGITALNNAAFTNAYSLRAISLPNTVTSIGSSVFNGCIGLRFLAIHRNASSIGLNVFFNCNTLQHICLPGNASEIQNSLTSQCYALADMTLPSIAIIKNNAFSNCWSLACVACPSSVTTIGAGAFANCYGLQYLDFTSHESVPTLANVNALSGIPADCKIRVPAYLVNKWKAATNWATYADHIVGIAQGGGSAN